MLNKYSYLPLCAAFLFLFQGIFVYLNAKGDRSVRLGFLLSSCATFWWQFSWFFLFNTSDISKGRAIADIGHVGIAMIPATFFHYYLAYIGLENYWKRVKWVYLIGILFIILIPTHLFVNGVNLFYWGFYPKAGILHPLFLAYLFITMCACVYYLVKKGARIKWEGMIGSHLSFLLVSMFVYSFSASDFLVNYGSPHYPLGVVAILLSLSISAYAIVRYRLMDIRLAVSNTAIFILVYALVLGIPYYLYLIGIKPVAFILAILLATAGPFIYFYIQKRAEGRLLKEQRRYQATLRQASAGMGKIKDLKKLLNMIVYVLTHAIQIEHAIVYIHDEANKQFVLGASKRKSGYKYFTEHIEDNSPLVQFLSKNRSLIIFEEIKQRSQDKSDPEFVQIAQIIFSIEGALIVPIFIDLDLTAIIVMGKKESGKAYTEDDIAVFSILANQTALAIENAKFYEDMKLTQKQLFQAEKMATIGTMADGLSHQINNRFHALGFIAGDALDTIQINKDENSPEKLKEIMAELERGFNRVQENVKQGGEIVQGLLKYTRKGESGFTAVDVDEVLKAALEMVQFKIKTYELKIVREYDLATMPKVKGNFTQLQEVFFNLIDNGYDAMMQRKTEAKEKDFQPTLIVKVSTVDNYAQIVFEDNGMGVREEDVYKLFTPFFTTKLSSKKGTGLGLYVIKKIVEDNHNGVVEMVSKYMHGTQMKLRLPIAIA